MTLTIKTGLCLGMTMLLASCGVTSNSHSVVQIHEVTLADGIVSRIGFQPVQDNWQCQELDRTKSNGALNKIKGTLSFSSHLQIQEQESIDYANIAHLPANYIYMYVPTEVTVGIFDSSMFYGSDTIYYRCQNPPAVRDDIFSLVR